MRFGAELSKENYVSLLAKRQTQIHEMAACQMTFEPKEQETAGLAVIQASNHQYHLERAMEDEKQVIRCVLYTSDYDCPPYFPGFKSETHRTVIAQAECGLTDLILEIEMDGEDFTFSYGASEDQMNVLCKADGALINPEKVGCMTGTIVGMYATGNGKDVENEAIFNWFEMK